MLLAKWVSTDTRDRAQKDKKMSEPSEPNDQCDKTVTIVHCSRGGFGVGVARAVRDRLRTHGCDVRVISAREYAMAPASPVNKWHGSPDVVVAISPVYFRMIPRTFKQFFRQTAFAASNVGAAPIADDCDISGVSETKVVPLITAGRPTSGAPRRRLAKFFGAHGWSTLHPGFDLAALGPRGALPDAEIDAVVDAIVTSE